MKRVMWSAVLPAMLIVAFAAALVAQASQQTLRFSEPIVIPAADTRAELATIKPGDTSVDRVVRTVATNGSAGHISVAGIAYNAGPAKWNGMANAHSRNTEVFHILKGSATFAFGGQIEGATAIDPKSEGARKLVGPGYSGKAAGNKVVKAVAGDTIILPPMTPHEVIRAEAGFEMLVIRIDPDRGLELK